jgi:hypothetical protein
MGLLGALNSEEGTMRVGFHVTKAHSPASKFGDTLEASVEL